MQTPTAPLHTEQSEFVWPLLIAGCCLTIVAALVLGVGAPGHMVLRHVVQTLSLWPAVVLGLRRSPAAGWFGLPVFLFWTALMTMIWLYLLGLSHAISGQFSPLEIAMAAIVGAASVLGTIGFVPVRSALTLGKGLAVFVGMLLFSVLCFRVSFLPQIAHR